MTRILIVDDHPMFREAVRGAIALGSPEAAIEEASSLDEAQGFVPERQGLDLILLDLVLPGVSGFDGLILIRAEFPDVPVLVFSGLSEANIAAEAIRAGAAGFVPKSASKAVLAKAITEVLNGAIYLPPEMARQIRSALRQSAPARDIASRIAGLTPSQIKVLQLVRQGLLNKQIAHELKIGETTVKAHVSEILRKLNVISRTQVVIETRHLDFDAFLKPDQPKR